MISFIILGNMKLPTLWMKSNKNDFSYGIDSTIAQILALTTTYLFSIKVGVDMMTPTIIIGAITDKHNDTAYNPLSQISEEQMSWIGENQNTPDSPMWLMSQGRTDEAKSTFNKLRGGVGEDKCAVEFRDMIYYTSEINLPTAGEKQEISSINDSLYYFIKPETLKPLQLLMIMIFFTNLLSGIPYTPYLISVFDKFQVSFHPAWATTMYTAFSVAGNVLTICSINKLGKRFLALCTMASCSVCYLSIGIVGNILPSSPVTSWIKIVLFFLSTFFSSMGIMPIVWILMCEIFPMKSKNVGAGISSATYFILSFLMTKFYLDLEVITGFYNTFVSFGALGLIGLVYLYFQLPETENKTLNEISEHFKCKNMKADVQPSPA
ncbi:PREDICTED: putative metabolite transport protein YwtG [Diuraphis noxia]|uniref:putative metabolite transport protein YwtG n=1 Tax=Diuraphis noxia TaxID=143948 RepID=UPI00076374ED|nr:PREDICTED: putative metabolite transport protein YwtG [Diuraphis noxia]